VNPSDVLPVAVDLLVGFCVVFFAGFLSAIVKHLLRTAQRRSWMRLRLPAGSRTAQSRIPYGRRSRVDAPSSVRPTDRRIESVGDRTHALNYGGASGRPHRIEQIAVEIGLLPHPRGYYPAAPVGTSRNGADAEV
jgi:hypothetical protein